MYFYKIFSNLKGIALIKIQAFLFPNYVVTFFIVRYIVKVKLATIIEGDPKVPFSIATTLTCRGGCFSIPWIVPLYL